MKQDLIQVRVTPETKNEIKAAAARRGMSIKKFLLLGAYMQVEELKGTIASELAAEDLGLFDS